MAEIIESDQIQGVKFAKLQAYGDERGRFMETFRTEWFPERSFDIVQTNRSDSVMPACCAACTTIFTRSTTGMCPRA